MMEKIKKDLIESAKKSRRILITSHMGPDDDAIGSMLATYTYLLENEKILEKKLKMRILGKIRNEYSYFKHFDKIKSSETMVEEAEKADMIIVLDGNSWTRFLEDIPNTKAKTFCLDHHPREKKLFDHEIIMPEKTSTSEIIYELFYKGTKIEKAVCEHLLAGILGDTGQLRFIDQTKTGVFLVVKDLIEQGDINVDSFLSEYTKMSLDTFALLKNIMSNATIRQVGDWPPYMLSFIEEEALGRFKGGEIPVREAAYSFTQYLKGVEGADWGFIVTPRDDDRYSISFRSMPEAPNVRLICEEMGIGGGHDRASGAKIEAKSVKEAILIIEKWLSQNKPKY